MITVLKSCLQGVASIQKAHDIDSRNHFKQSLSTSGLLLSVKAYLLLSHSSHSSHPPPQAELILLLLHLKNALYLLLFLYLSHPFVTGLVSPYFQMMKLLERARDINYRLGWNPACVPGPQWCLLSKCVNKVQNVRPKKPLQVSSGSDLYESLFWTQYLLFTSPKQTWCLEVFPVGKGKGNDIS